MLLSGASMTLGALIKYGTLSPWEHLQELSFFAKLPLAIITGTGILYLYYQLKRIPHQKFLPIVIVFFLAIDPLFLSFSRYLHLDGLNALLILLSLAHLSLYSYNKTLKDLRYSALFAGLGFLTRTSSLSLVPFVLIVVIFSARTQRTSRSRFLIKHLANWLLISTGTFVFLWPAMWVSPVRTLSTLTNFSSGAFVHSHKPPEGQISVTDSSSKNEDDRRKPLSFDPKLLWDFVVNRSVIILVFGIIGYASVLRRVFSKRKTPYDAFLFVLLAFSAYFIILLSFAKMATTIVLGFRYGLTSFVIFQMAAGYGFYIFLDRLYKYDGLKRVTRLIVFYGLIATMCLHSYQVFSLHPYYQSYHNELIKPSVIGWGEGLELVANHLNMKHDASELVVASWYPCVFSKYFHGKTISLPKVKDQHPDYIVLYNNQVNRDLEKDLVERFYRNQSINPEFTAVINGMEYAWLYKYL